MPEQGPGESRDPLPVASFGRWFPTFTLVFLLSVFFSALAAAKHGSDRPVLHILDRAAFGPTAADIQQAKEIGVDRYIGEQLDRTNSVAI